MKIVKRGSIAWHKWRNAHLDIRPDLGSADLTGADLKGAKLTGADLTRAILYRLNLSGADLTRADLTGAILLEGNLSGADLSRADLRGANLIDADLSGANLSGANLSRANLADAYLGDARLDGAILIGVRTTSRTVFPQGFDLRGPRGPLTSLDAVGIPYLRLSERARNSLMRANIRTLSELVQKTEAEMFQIKNFGRKHLNEIKETLASMGLSLRDEGRNPAALSKTFTITFDPELSPSQIKATLQAMADYYRDCGGVGFKIDWEFEEVRVGELSHV